MTPYVGEHVQEIFAEAPVEHTIPKLAEKGSEVLQNWIERNTPVAMGTLRASWYATPPAPTSNPRGPALITYVRTEVDYAPHVEWGTGIFGPQGTPYTIRPKQPGGTLSWIDKRSGERVYAKSVQHPGSPGQHMVAIGAAMTEHVFPAEAEGVLHEWKLETEMLAR